MMNKIKLSDIGVVILFALCEIGFLKISGLNIYEYLSIFIIFGFGLVFIDGYNKSEEKAKNADIQKNKISLSKSKDSAIITDDDMSKYYDYEVVEKANEEE